VKANEREERRKVAVVRKKEEVQTVAA